MKRTDHPPIFTPDEIDLKQLFPTQDLQNAYQHLGITTSPGAATELFDDKTKMLAEVLATKRLPQDILKTHETIYVSSGVDIEYPLCLGARKIVMVDSGFSEKSMVDTVINKATSLDSRANISDSNGKRRIQFSFDFGNGKEDVTIVVEPKIFQKEHASHHKVGDAYEMPPNVGMILGYRTQDALIDDNGVRENLIPGGIILVDHLTMSSHEYFEARDAIPGHSAISKDEVKKQVYQNRGYEYVPLKTNSKRGWEKSFLIKNT